jgi:hypothetical protein
VDISVFDCCDCVKLRNRDLKKFEVCPQFITSNSLFRVKRLWILSLEQLGGKHSLTKNIFCFLGSESNAVVLFSIVI